MDPGTASSALQIAGPLAGAVLGGKGGSKKGAPSSAFRFSTPGYEVHGSSGDRNYAEVNRNPAFWDPITQRQESILTGLDALGNEVDPAYGRLIKAARDNIENARTKAVGGLRDTLQQRRLTGSSFGDAAVTQAEREFGQAQNQAESQAIIQSIAASAELLNQKSQVLQQQIGTALSELGIGAQVQGQYAALQQSANNTMLALQAQEEAGRGQLYGTLGAKAGDILGEYVAPGSTPGGFQRLLLQQILQRQQNPTPKVVVN